MGGYRWNRHRRASERMIAGLQKLGFEPLVKNPENRIWHVIAVVPPRGANEAQIRQTLLDKHNIEIASGLGELSGKILRIGVMGPLATDANVDLFLDAIAGCV